MKQVLHSRAHELAKVMHRIASWSNEYPEQKRRSASVIKLPPVFLGGVNGDTNEGMKNLEAMIKTVSDYQSSNLTLAELPERYASYGGQFKGDEIGTRRIHNWLHQVAFGIRAAMVEIHNDGKSPKEVAASVVSVIEDAPLIFVARAGNEYRPLRYASVDTKVRWLCDEVNQRRAGVNYSQYGAQITEDEWCQHGVGMQFRVAHSMLKENIERLAEQANQLDKAGRFEEADAIDNAVLRIHRSNTSIEETNRT